MSPSNLYIGGIQIAIWDVCFLLAISAAYFIFRRSIAPTQFSNPLVRYTAIVYLSAIAAQLFAHVFDATGSLRPAPGGSLLAWYLNPVGTPKTLYGVIVLMPASVWIGTVGLRITLRQALDFCTPALLAVLAIIRIGCFLQGCCYGAPSALFGVTFPVGSPVYFHQLEAGMITAGAAPIPVVPTQILEAAFLALLTTWTLQRGVYRGHGLFLPTIGAYSVFRFVIEFVRADAERGFYGTLATSQWIALAVLFMVLLSVASNLLTRAPESV